MDGDDLASTDGFEAASRLDLQRFGNILPVRGVDAHTTDLRLAQAFQPIHRRVV